MRISETLDSFEAWLGNARDLSPHSRRAYLSDVHCFIQLAGDQPVSVIADRHILTMLDSLRVVGSKPTTIRRRYIGTRLYLQWLHKAGEIKSDPTLDLELRFKKPRSLPKALSSPEVRRLLASCQPSQKGSGSQTSKTTFLCVALMVATGIRVGELVALRHQDVDVPAQLLRVRGKGQRERVVYLSNRHLCAALESHQQSNSCATTALLQNRHGRPLTTAAVRGRISRAATTAGLTRRITPHMLRHTAATQLIEAGVDIRYIQRLLGHASISTTEIYTHVADQSLRDAVLKADVLGSLMMY